MTAGAPCWLCFLTTNCTTGFHKEYHHHHRPFSYLDNYVGKILLRHMKSFPNNILCLHNYEPLAKLAIEDDLLAETAKMKKDPGPSWC